MPDLRGVRGVEEPARVVLPRRAAAPRRPVRRGVALIPTPAIRGVDEIGVASFLAASAFKALNDKLQQL